MPPTAGRPSRVRWTVLALMCLAGFVAYVLRKNMSVAGAAMIGELGISELQFGIVLAAFTWGYGLAQIPGALAGERFGARRTLAGAALAWGILTLATALVPGTEGVSAAACVAALVVLRFLMGVAQAPLYPVTGGISTVVWFPTTRWALVNGLSTTALTLGAAAAAPAVAWLAFTVGWRQSFLALAPLGFVVAGLGWWLYRDDPAAHRGVGPEELALIRAGRAAGEDPGRERVSWRVVARRPGVLALTASYFCVNYVFYLFFNWFFYYLVNVRGVPPQLGGAFVSGQWMV
ncbi:MAG: MFS transporter, partial [Thermoanaerobaculia bacterium]